MKNINSLNDLKKVIELNDNVWLLLYKAGSPLSECAAEEFLKAGNETGEKQLLVMADVNTTKDIHPSYGINTVPAVLHFEKGRLNNVVKGCHKAEQFTAILNKSAVNLSDSGKKEVQKRVTVYTTPTCTWCNTIKRHFHEHGIAFQEVDVSLNQKAAEEMVRRSGQQGVPQTDINGEIIVGFDKNRINTLLNIN